MGINTFDKYADRVKALGFELRRGDAGGLTVLNGTRVLYARADGNIGEWLADRETDSDSAYFNKVILRDEPKLADVLPFAQLQAAIMRGIREGIGATEAEYGLIAEKVLTEIDVLADKVLTDKLLTSKAPEPQSTADDDDDEEPVQRDPDQDDLTEQLTDLIRYARSTCDVLVCNEDLNEPVLETIAGISAHLERAIEMAKKIRNWPSKALSTDGIDAVSNDVLGSLYAIEGQAKILRQDAIEDREYVLSIAHVIVNECELAIKLVDRPS